MPGNALPEHPSERSMRSSKRPLVYEQQKTCHRCCHLLFIFKKIAAELITGLGIPWHPGRAMPLYKPGQLRCAHSAYQRPRGSRLKQSRHGALHGCPQPHGDTGSLHHLHIASETWRTSPTGHNHSFHTRHLQQSLRLYPPEPILPLCAEYFGHRTALPLLYIFIQIDKTHPCGQSESTPQSGLTAGHISDQKNR